MDGRCLDQIDVDIAEDSFAFFSSSSSQDGLISSTEEMSPSRGAPVPLGAPLMNFPLNTFLAPFLTVDPGGGGLVDVDDLVMGGFEPVPDLPSQSCSSLADWSLPHETVSSHTSMVQQYNLQCGSCQILHCVIHSNGVQDTKLEIHGCDGQSYNAVLHTRFCVEDGFPTTLEQQIVEFPVGNAEYVKQFLLQYSLLRRKEGFVLRHDSTASLDAASGYGLGSDCVNDSSAPFPKSLGHSLFSDLHCSSSALGSFDSSLVADKDLQVALSGMPYISNAFGKSLLGQSKTNRTNSMDSIAETSNLPAKPPKSNAAAQRERTGKLKMTDLAQHFHLPINAAAKELGICPTVLKKICRRNGMRRWPHRKIKSIERIIATLEQTIAEGAGQGDEGIRMEIAMLRNERAQLCAGLLGES